MGAEAGLPLGNFIQQTFPEASYSLSGLALGPGTDGIQVEFQDPQANDINP